MHAWRSRLRCPPANAPLARLVTNIAGQSELNPDDPIGSLSTIAEALALTAVKTAVPVVNEDVQASENNLESLSYQPRQTLSERLAVASDPRTPLPSVQDALSAVIKVGTIGFNAVKTVVQTVATPRHHRCDRYGGCCESAGHRRHSGREAGPGSGHVGPTGNPGTSCL